MSQSVRRALTIFTVTLNMFGTAAAAMDVNATVTALRLSNTITGGLMPSTDPIFAQMVASIEAGDVKGAATMAAQSKYSAAYLARRLAFQMQSPAMDASTVTDNDATAYLIAHFTGVAATKPSISTIWSENATYLVNVTDSTGKVTPTHAASLTAAQLAGVNWTTDLVRMDGQTARGTDGNPITIPAKHVGGYATLSDRANDSSFAMFGATAGTNLRMIEGIWEISTGLQLMDVATDAAQASDAPRFVPEYDPNFFHGQGQTACIACHGGGMSSLTHGYATVADLFDFDPSKGFTYIANPTTATMKSLGSDPSKRATNATCNLGKTPSAVCNPDSAGAGTTQSWDLTKAWQSVGVLAKMGWNGPTSGQGLNALGSALGQASIVYEFMTKRVIKEVCPGGDFTDTEISNIAAQANPYARPAGTDDVRTIVALVASNASCL